MPALFFKRISRPPSTKFHSDINCEWSLSCRLTMGTLWLKLALVLMAGDVSAAKRARRGTIKHHFKDFYVSSVQAPRRANRVKSTRLHIWGIGKLFAGGRSFGMGVVKSFVRRCSIAFSPINNTLKTTQSFSPYAVGARKRAPHDVREAQRQQTNS